MFIDAMRLSFNSILADVICLSIYVGCKINDEEEENLHNYIHINQGQNEGGGVVGVLVSVESVLKISGGL
jgi:hypothetical protein